jgi:uncharacterized protein YndB with AHSA1/START domain
MSDATLLKTGLRPVLRFERSLPGPIETVWVALTDPVEMRAWFPTRIEIEEWKVGASLTHHFDEHDVAPLPGIVLEWDPPRHASFTWGQDTISFHLSTREDGQVLFVLTEELDASRAARNAAGWDICLDRLESGVEGEAWATRFDRYIAIFEPRLGDQEGPPEEFHPSGD